MRCPTGISVLALCAGAMLLPTLGRAGEAPSVVVATVGSSAITKAQLDAAIGANLCSLETDAYNRKVQILNELMDKLLESQEATHRGIPVEELEKAEITEKAAPVAEADVNAAYENVKSRFPDKAEADLKRLIGEDFKRQHQQSRRNEFHRELRGRAGTRILLEPPRVAVREDGDPSKGPKDAPVHVLEFSDFQCPYCARVEPVVKRLGETYGDKMRLVFRNYPLPTHAQAPKAAEAAACAGDQGKFWEMHDRLFAHQDKLQVADLKATAVELGLDPQAFGECLDSGKHEGEWKSDQKDGDGYGVQATPWFFINGRCLSGAQPYENFVQVIDDELARVGESTQAKAR